MFFIFLQGFKEDLERDLSTDFTFFVRLVGITKKEDFEWADEEPDKDLAEERLELKWKRGSRKIGKKVSWKDTLLMETKRVQSVSESSVDGISTGMIISSFRSDRLTFVCLFIHPLSSSVYHLPQCLWTLDFLVNRILGASVLKKRKSLKTINVNCLSSCSLSCFLDFTSTERTFETSFPSRVPWCLSGDLILLSLCSSWKWKGCRDRECHLMWKKIMINVLLLVRQDQMRMENRTVLFLVVLLFLL